MSHQNVSGAQAPLLTPFGNKFELEFIAGLPNGVGGPYIYVAMDGSLHAGALIWVKNVLSPTGASRVLRTTNPVDGVHSVFDIAAESIVGHALALPRWRNSDWPLPTTSA